MKPCSQCHRHVRRAESACPFCGAALHDAPAPPTLAAWSLGATLLIACGPGPAPASSESDSTSTTGTTTTSPASTTNTPTTTTDVSTSTTGAPTPTSADPTNPPDCGCENACDGGDESAAFIYASPPPDVGGPHYEIDCDIFAQDCCPGRKCAPWTHNDRDILNGTHCVPVTGDQQPGEPCTVPDPPDTPPTGHDDCAAGAMCWAVDAMGHGTCIAQCTGTADAPVCAPGLVCNLSNQGALAICVPGCDPLQQDCDPGEVCIPADDSFVCVVDASDDEGQANDPCEFVNGCDPGLTCLNTAIASSTCAQDQPGCCQPFCEFPDSPCPNPDQKCIQWFDPMMPIPPGDEDIGVCAVPA